MVDFSNHRPEREPAELARVFRYFGEVECPKLDSPVYQAYSLGVANDPELLALAARVQATQPSPNVLYAAVKDLLLEDAERSDAARRLACFYPSISGAPIPDEDPWPCFRRFCLEHSEELLPAIETGRTQTCVVHRCTALLPAFASLDRVREAGGRIALLEIGPAAGLNLRLDHYRYAYRDSGSERTWGDPSATPRLDCEVRGSAAPPLPDRLEVEARHGLELAPIDVGDPRALRWLRALVWPEHVERARLMDEALEVARRVPARIEAGDATRDLEAAIERLPAGAPRVLFATQALYQIPPEGVEQVLDAMARASRRAPLDFVALESDQQGASLLDHYAFAQGEQTGPVTLARADSHGRWIEWRGRSRAT